MTHKSDVAFLKQALSIADQCQGAAWYSVGCVITDQNRKIIATGFTNEMPVADGKEVHAEHAAIKKALSTRPSLEGCILYSTLEPCSVRASGSTPCVQLISAALFLAYADVTRYYASK
jgi:5-amino-6-(5-phosphoribosylamino)uracil reductase